MRLREKIWIGTLITILVLIVIGGYWARRATIQYDFDVAINSGDLETVKRLATRGASLEYNWWNKSSPMHRAVASGQTEVVRWLVDEGVALDRYGDTVYVPLEFALDRRRAEEFRILREGGAEFDSARSEGVTRFVSNASALSEYALEEVLDQVKSAGDQNNLDLSTIGSVIGVHRRRGIQLLQDAGADFNQVSGLGHTLLHGAAVDSPLRIPILLEVGVDPTVRDRHGASALDHFDMFYGKSDRPDLKVVRAKLVEAMEQWVSESE